MVFDDLRIFGRSTKLDASMIISMTSLGKVGKFITGGEDGIPSPVILSMAIPPRVYLPAEKFPIVICVICPECWDARRSDMNLRAPVRLRCQQQSLKREPRMVETT